MASYAYYPHVGGIETVGGLLAEEFIRQGHELKVVTHVAETGGDRLPYEVLRRPNLAAFLRTVVWCEILFHNNISMRYVWPLALVARPWVIAHHGWISRSNGRVGVRDWWKRWLTRFATNVCISQALPDMLPVACTVIPNPYQASVFRVLPNVQRNQDLVFLGRLVSEKGAAILLQALATIARKRIRPSLSIIGDGPERPLLERLANELGLQKQVRFCGQVYGPKLAALLNQHRLLVVPSLLNEPFGLVAIEGIACGCVVAGSEGGGLKDAIGPCGMTFANGDVTALASVLQTLLQHTANTAKFLEAGELHLRKHRPDVVAAQYLEVFKAAIR